MILRSDNGEIWRDHTLEATENAVQGVLNESFEGEGNTSYYLYYYIKEILLTHDESCFEMEKNVRS